MRFFPFVRLGRGPLGERLAAQFLRKQGYGILRRNCRSRWGEIDLVAREGDEVVFVEVKARASDAWGEPEEAVTRTKQQRIARAAIAFADRYRLREHPLRFDVVAVLIPSAGAPQFRHYPHAFPLPRNLRT